MTDPTDPAIFDPVRRGLASRFVHLPLAMTEGVPPHYTVEDPRTGGRATLRAWPHALSEQPGGGRGAWIAAARAAIEPATRIRHDFVVSVTDVGLTHEAIAYLQMEAVDGPYLREFALPAGGAPVWRVAEVARQGAEGLAAIHAAGLVHGALTPDSLIIDGGPPRVRLLDLGLSAIRADVDPSAGGPHDADFAAPEVLAGQPPTAASDIYSLAAVARAMLAGAGRRPLPPEIAAVLAVALADDPAQRFGSAREFAAALEEAVGTSASPARPVPMAATTAAAQPGWRPGLRPALVALGSIAVVGLLLLLATTRSGPGTDRRSDEEDVGQASTLAEPEPRDDSTPASPLRRTPPLPAVIPSPASQRPAAPRPRASGLASSSATAPPEASLPAPDPTAVRPTTAPAPRAPAAPAAAADAAGAQAAAAQAAAAQAAAAQAVRRVAQAVEARDLAALTAALPELTPGERTGWEQLFEVARDLRADLQVGRVQIRGGVAEARVSGAYEFENRSINRRERLPVAMQATLVRESGRWKILALRRRPVSD